MLYLLYISGYYTETTLVFRLHQIQSQGKTSPTGPPKPANKLDNMLGSLQSDLNRLGVQTVAKGVCGACKKPIVGQVMITLNHGHASNMSADTQLDLNWHTLHTCVHITSVEHHLEMQKHLKNVNIDFCSIEMWFKGPN